MANFNPNPAKFEDFKPFEDKLNQLARDNEGGIAHTLKLWTFDKLKQAGNNLLNEVGLGDDKKSGGDSGGDSAAAAGMVA